MKRPRKVLLAVGLLFVLAPAAAWAGECDVTTLTGPIPAGASVRAVILEAIEHVGFVATTTGLVREASANETGTLSDGCGALASLEGRIHSHATSTTPVSATGDLGVGDITGTFHIYPDGSGSGSVKGVLVGYLDFTPTNAGNTTCGGPCPWVWAWGSWTTSGKNPTGGGFVGVAFVPFPCSWGWCYLDDPLGSLSGVQYNFIPLTQKELTPAPSAKFVVTLFQ